MIFLILLSFHLSFANSESPDFIQSLQSFDAQVIKRSSSNCQLKLNENLCDFKRVCQVLEKRFDQKYLYENSKGEKLENFQLSWFRKSAVRCLGDLEKDLKMGTTPFLQDFSVESRKDLDQASFDLKEKRLGEVFQKTKDEAIFVLKRKAKKSPQLAGSLENLIERIRLIDLEVLRFSHNGYSGSCDLPNAFFKADSSSIQVCSQILDLPEGALMGILAHEIGHALDPCNASLNYFQYPSGLLRISRFDELADEEQNTGNQSPELKVKKLELNQYPFKSTVACLQKPDAAHLKKPAQTKQHQRIQQQLMEPDLSVEDRQYLNIKQREIKKAFQDNPFCSSTSDSNHTEELFSDWFSSQVMESFVEKAQSQARKKELSFESFLFLVANSCPGLQQKVKDLFLKGHWGAQLKNCEAFDPTPIDWEKEGIYNEHPETLTRYDRVLLARPLIRKALQCTQKKSPRVCE